MIKKDYGLNVQMRVAGGWVRDKLLGSESDDIDIAVDMPGFKLAKIIADAAVKYNINESSQPYKVSLDKTSNPTSKVEKDELMVGSIYLFGQKIEFVPMRTEYYPDPNSRQPIIANTGDPKEDVMRRDLTINALYYNVDTGKVEDYVGGKVDLGLNGGSIILKTPDEAHKTLKEDPLRVLRVLRFHSKYPDSKIDKSILEAMKQPDIHESYIKKVASERAGPEIIKMLESADPTDALRLLFNTGLYKAVFKVPAMESINPEGIHMDQQTPYHKYNLLDHILEVVKNLNKIMINNKESNSMRGLMNMAALFHDFGKMKEGIQQPHSINPDQMQYLGHEDASIEMADSIMKSIGIGEDDRDIVNTVIGMHMRPMNMDSWSKKAKGRFLRDTRRHGKEEAHKDLWKYILYHSQADAMSSIPENYDVEKRQNFFNDFQNFVDSPAGVFQKPLIDGYEIMTLFPNLDPKTGFIKEIQETIQEMQDIGELDISFVKLPDGPEKKQLSQMAKSKALEIIQQLVPDINNKYGGNNKMSKNWFKKIVISQVVPEGKLPNNSEEVVRGPQPASSNYEVNIKVRDRRKGMVNPQEYGVITNISNNKMTILWNPNNKKKKHEETYDLIEDTEILSFIVAEV